MSSGRAGGSPTRGRALLADSRVRFLVVGSLSALLELGSFQAFIAIDSTALVANAASFVIGLVASFTGYRLWSFVGQHSMPLGRQAVAYASLAAVNVALTSAIIYALVTWGTVPWVAKAMCMVLVAVWNYLLLNRVIFSRVAGR